MEGEQEKTGVLFHGEYKKRPHRLRVVAALLVRCKELCKQD